MSEAEFVPGLDRAVAGSSDAFSARNALLGWLQDIAPYGIFTTDSDLKIQTWNKWLTAHGGPAAEAVVGRRLFDAFPDIAKRRLDEHFQRALQGEVSVLSTALHRYLIALPPTERDPNAPQMLQTVRIAPLPAGDLIVGTIAIIEDVTQRELQSMRLKRQQEHDQLLSSSLAVLLQSTDPLRDVTALFPQRTLSLGLDAYFNYIYDEKSGTLRLNSAGGILPRQKEAITTIALGEGLSGECAKTRTAILYSNLHERNDRSSELLQSWGFKAYYCFPLIVGDRLLGTLSFGSSTRSALAVDELEHLSRIAQYFAIALDRALREQALDVAQRRLTEHAVNLETKVAERTARLQETIAELESFSYTVAHDLRAPIRALRGYADVLIDDYQLPSAGVQIAQRIQRASDRLDALTRDLLRFTQIARLPVALETIDVEALINELTLMIPALQGEVLTVAGPLPKVRADRSLLQQCLANLFDNALKFVVPGKRPRIVVRREDPRTCTVPERAPARAFNPALRHSGLAGPPAPSTESTEPATRETRVRICVQDNGPGIPREAHDKIFGIFERGTAGEMTGGTGIGLAIVARAAAKMNGTCGVDSTPGEGSCFWLELARAD